MRIQLTKPIGALLTAGLIALPNLVQAQPSAHYPPGLEGIKGGTLPPPGLWLRDYNLIYQSSHLDDAQGNKIGAAGAHAFIYAQAPRLVWITEKQIFGGYLGLDALLPVEYTHLRANTPGGQFYSSTFGIGDVFGEGTWSRHWKQWDVGLGAGVWAPTGNSAPPLTTRAGLGYWTYMLTAGATWYIDSEKKWSVSALNRYEFSTEKEDTEQIPGQAYTLEWGVSREIYKGIDFGAVGYYQQQVNPTTGSSWCDRNRVAAAGPEISAFFPKWMLGVSFRYEYEFMAESRLQGQTFSLTITKKL